MHSVEVNHSLIKKKKKILVKYLTKVSGIVTEAEMNGEYEDHPISPLATISPLLWLSREVKAGS